MLVDAHTHVVPAYSGQRGGMRIHAAGYGKLFRSERGDWRPGAKRGVYRAMPPSFESCTVSPALLLEYLDWAGIDRAVLMQAPMYGEINEYVASVVEQYPDKFVGMALVDPRSPSALDELRFVAGLGLKGVKIEVPDTPFWIDDDAYAPYWAEMEALALILSIDLGWDPMENPYNFQIDRLERVVARHPDLNVVLVHLGVSGLWREDEVAPYPRLQQTLSLVKYPKTVFELSGLPEFAEWEEYPYPRAQDIVRAVAEVVPADRIMWGSDFPGILPYCSYLQTLDLVRRNCSFFSADDMANVLGGTAARLFQLA